MGHVLPFLMFQDGKAEEAMNYYTSLITDSEILSVSRYPEGKIGKEGTVMKGVFSLKGQEFMCNDSTFSHEFSFSPSYSIFISCDSMQEITYLYENLVNNGQALITLDTYGFSRQFAWVSDRFGMSWQLNLPYE
ncbi:VOC family protein [Sporosarcina obsidiansis]|uniref:VOC family protein n=1 Tax=Sporosarcina obsidiansis TaxID=2660748 RepID=UPI00129B7E66|nr:VOC family protein [Sporosarcina obsidiansis]